VEKCFVAERGIAVFASMHAGVVQAYIHTWHTTAIYSLVGIFPKVKRFSRDSRNQGIINAFPMADTIGR
jgi:hypothetical protein